VVVFAVAGAWLTGRLAPRRPSDALTALLERASAEGLVIPGGEAGASGSVRTYRSGGVADDEAARALERMRTEHERAPFEHRDVHRLVAGLVASGRMDLAGDYVEEGLARAPGDPHLLTLSAIVAHRNGDLSTAERRLRAALQASPGDPTVMLNLAIVLAEAWRTHEADSLFSEVIRKAPDAPLADRARRAQSALPRR
jgi:Flp pilus assembly protein TadD